MLWMTGCACGAAMQPTPLFWEVIVDLQLVETSMHILYHIIIILYHIYISTESIVRGCKPKNTGGHQIVANKK